MLDNARRMPKGPHKRGGRTTSFLIDTPGGQTREATEIVSLIIEQEDEFTFMAVVQNLKNSHEDSPYANLVFDKAFMTGYNRHGSWYRWKGAVGSWRLYR